MTSRTGSSYYTLLSLQAIERVAWWIVLVQMALYLAQPNYPGGLELSHLEKGLVFSFWALAKNLTPIFSGSYISQKGGKGPLSFGAFLAATGYFLLAFTGELIGVLGCVLLMGMGVGMFQNALQYMLSESMDYIGLRALSPNIESPNKQGNKKQGRKIIAWAGYQWVINLAVFLGGFLSAKLLDLDMQYVFWGSASIMLLVFLLSLYIKEPLKEHIQRNADRIRWGAALQVLRNDRAFALALVSFSLFTFAYMQFYETLPNYLADFAQSNELGKAMSPIAEFFGQGLGELGFRIEYLYNLNALITLLLVIPLAYFSRGASPLKALALGLVLVSIGMAFLFLGAGLIEVLMLFLIYTIGEAIVNPRILQISEGFAPDSSKRPIYLGLMFISWAIGLGSGGLVGGWLYGWLTGLEGLSAYTGGQIFWLITIILTLVALIPIQSIMRSRGVFR